ncbi:hypothetical protein ACFZBP_41940 [Streptomyces sp. NPDC008086]|uniref:hypothetical protein n=1 Tax=Streptomyces sp. NPDC008086 TaxID=3364807 RepID=UPI0036F0C66C
MTALIERLVTSGTFELDGGCWEVDNDVWLIGNDGEVFPTFNPAAEDVAFYERGAGIARPEATVTAHLYLARAHGADLHFAEVVLGWEADGPGGKA